MTAQQRYDELCGNRDQYLSTARVASELTIPYLVTWDNNNRNQGYLPTPWQSVGAKGVVTLASKLMLALLPVQTTFFKLQVDTTKLGDEFPPQIKTELDLSFSKIEKTVMDSIAQSDDRVVVHQAIKHLVVSGNALIFMGKEGLKLYPLNRYVLERDGNGNVIEIVTLERIARSIFDKKIPGKTKQPNQVMDDGVEGDDVPVYTYVKRENNRMVWHQEVFGKIIPGSQGKSPLKTTPWLPLRFNSVDGEEYGRGRVEEFLGDLKSLEALSQALVEGSSVAAKVIFTVSPSSTTKPATLAKAGNGAIVQGRPDDIACITTGGKTADFKTAAEMAGNLEKRLADAFLIMQVRQSERTTAEEVRVTQMELEQQLGGLFSLLTVEFLVPYLNRKLSTLSKAGKIPKLPAGVVEPTIVAGINALGRGQDNQALGMFLQTIAQTLGPEAIGQYVNVPEVINRLAASQGIDTLNLIKTEQQVQGKEQQMMAQQQGQQMELQAEKNKPAMASAPMNDPSKNPKLQRELEA